MFLLQLLGIKCEQDISLSLSLGLGLGPDLGPGLGLGLGLGPGLGLGLVLVLGLTCSGGSVAPLLRPHGSVSVLLLRDQVAIACHVDRE